MKHVCKDLNTNKKDMALAPSAGHRCASLVAPLTCWPSTKAFFFPNPSQLLKFYIKQKEKLRLRIPHSFLQYLLPSSRSLVSKEFTDNRTRKAKSEVSDGSDTGLAHILPFHPSNLKLSFKGVLVNIFGAAFPRSLKKLLNFSSSEFLSY